MGRLIVDGRSCNVLRDLVQHVRLVGVGVLVLSHAIVSLVVLAVVALVAGRAFCGWVCPVPAVSRLRGAVSKGSSAGSRSGAGGLTEEEKALLKTSCAGGCAERRGAVDSWHFVLGGALLSAAVFGFPVFCLVCPIGLTFATV